MSISFNHPDNTVTSTNGLSLIVSNGSTTSPQPIRLISNSVIMPVRALPTGEAGAMVFDNSSKTLKYHDGTSWVELLSKDTILEPIYLQIQNINTALSQKVDSVTYSTSAIPTASISGTNLNIVFPTPGTSSNNNGLFTSLPPGSITYYSLTSGQNIASIREQLSGTTGGQDGRDGSQSNPFISKTGWCLSDGLWWVWNGSNGTVLKQVPALNSTASYLKSLGSNGITRTDNVIVGSGQTGSTSLSIAQLPPHNFTVSGTTDPSGLHSHNMYYNPMGWQGSSPVKDGTGRDNGGEGVHTTDANGTHQHNFNGVTNTLGSGQGHSHSLDSLDVTHFNVAVLYNIAEPSLALNQDDGDERYVLKSGDTMSGSLTIANSATVTSNDTNLLIWLRNNAGSERAVIYHNSSNNTLRLRSSGGSEVTVDNNGLLTTLSLNVTANNAVVSGKNIVRSVNNASADINGNVNISTTSANPGTNGWWRDDNTGIIHQWGRGNQPPRDAGDARYQAFNISFPNACFNVQVTHGKTNNTAWSPTIAAWAATPTRDGVYIRAENDFFWYAIGN